LQLNLITLLEGDFGDWIWSNQISNGTK